MFERLPITGEGVGKYNHRKGLVSSLAVFLSAAALIGCGSDKTKTNHETLTLDAIPSQKLPRQKSGKGDKTFRLKLEQMPTLDTYMGVDEHQLIIGVDMDCKQSGVQSTGVTIVGSINDYGSYSCHKQFDYVPIPQGDRLLSDDEVTVKVDASNDNVPWVVGIGIRDIE